MSHYSGNNRVLERPEVATLKQGSWHEKKPACKEWEEGLFRQMGAVRQERTGNHKVMRAGGVERKAGARGQGERPGL